MICSDDTTTNPSKWEARGGFGDSPVREAPSLHSVAFRKRLEDFETRLASSVRQFQQLSKSTVSARTTGTNSIPGTGPEQREPRYEEQQAQKMRQLGAAQTITRKLIILSKQRPLEVNNAFIERELTKCAQWVWDDFKAMVTADMEQCRLLIEDYKNSVGDFVTQQSRAGHGLVSRDSFANTGESRIMKSEAERLAPEIRRELASHSNQDMDGSTSRADCETAHLRVKKIKRAVGFDRIPSGVGKKPQHSKTMSSGHNGLMPNSPFIKPESQLAHEAIVRIKNKFGNEQEKDQSVEILLTGTNTKQDEVVLPGIKVALLPSADGAVNDYQLDELQKSSAKKASVSPLNGSQFTFPQKYQSMNPVNEDSNFTALKLWTEASHAQDGFKTFINTEEKIASRKGFLTWLEAVNEAELMREFTAPPNQSPRYMNEGVTPVNPIAVKRQIPKLSSKLTLTKAVAPPADTVPQIPSPKITKIPTLKLPSSALGSSMNASTSQINISLGGTKPILPKPPKLVLKKTPTHNRKLRLEKHGVGPFHRGGSCVPDVGWSGASVVSGERETLEMETAAGKTGDQFTGEVVIQKILNFEHTRKDRLGRGKSLSGWARLVQRADDKRIGIIELLARSHQKRDISS